MLKNRESGEPFIQVEGLSKRYPGGHQALINVSLTVRRGRTVLLIGPFRLGQIHSSALSLWAGRGR